MCCCCPSAITALFCLWVQSGCSKGTVAGALTFFPPEPALYEFERRDRNGRILGRDEEALTGEMSSPSKPPKSEKKRNSRKSSSAADDPKARDSPNTSPEDPEDLNKSDDEDEDSMGEIRESPERAGPLEPPCTNGQTHEKIQSPAEQLMEQVAGRRRRAKQRAERDRRDAAAGVTYRLLLDPRLLVPPHEDGCIRALKIPCRPQSRRGGGIPSVYLAAVLYSVPAARRTSRTKMLIYSHGNATDVGAMFPIQVILSHSLDCDVLVYDYSGYGESGGVPDEDSTYNDIDAVYEYVWEELVEGQSDRIVLYGQSVGSGPCCYLAAKLAKEREVLGGMILHSPFTSGMRVLTPSRMLACLDIYPNIDRIKRIACPCMIIHGNLDQEVDVSHGQELYRAIPQEWRRDPWWVADRGHNDITDGAGKLAEYIRRLRTFLRSLDE